MLVIDMTIFTSHIELKQMPIELHTGAGRAGITRITGFVDSTGAPAAGVLINFRVVPILSEGSAPVNQHMLGGAVAQRESCVYVQPVDGTLPAIATGTEEGLLVSAGFAVGVPCA